MNLLRAVSTIGGLTLVSRVLGMLAAANRPMRVFSVLSQAEDWIQRQPRL